MLSDTDIRRLEASIDRRDSPARLHRSTSNHQGQYQPLSFPYLPWHYGMPRPCSTQKPTEPQEPQEPHTVSLKSKLRQPAMPQKRRVTLTETYTVATTCKRKLGTEAGRSDHQLRRLVCHANMLDMLMEELADRERGLESKLNAAIRAAPQPQSGHQVQWLDRIAEELEEVESDSDLDNSDDDSDEEFVNPCKVIKAKSPLPQAWAGYFAKTDEEEPHEDEEAQDAELILRRWPSKKVVPELEADGESDLEDEECSSYVLNRFEEHCRLSPRENTTRGPVTHLISDSNIRITAVAIS